MSPSPIPPPWPTGWPSFTPAATDPTDTLQKTLKAHITTHYTPSALRTSWLKTCAALSGLTSRLASAGTTAIPILSYADATSTSALENAKAAGCFLVRGVIAREEAEAEFGELREFVEENEGEITGWPREKIAIYSVFSTPTQLRVKTHPRHLRLQRCLNALWSDSSSSTEDDHVEPVLYPDAVRIREPGTEFLGLGPHVDGGSLCRWADPEYLRTYDAIFAGRPEEYDPYDMAHRKNANMSMFPGGAQCSVFRGFQGWTALTPAGPGEGTLMLVPDVKVVTAYMMLRPFFKMPEGEDAWRDPEKWEFDDSSWFPGTYRWDSQLLSPASHPHLCLEETLVSIPRVEPGDTVWWHADMCHAVETTHNGSLPASVCYIPACPSTPMNQAYIRQHWKGLVAGVPPEDYKYLDGAGSELILSTLNERKLKGALSLDSISLEGRRGLGEGV